MLLGGSPSVTVLRNAGSILQLSLLQRHKAGTSAPQSPLGLSLAGMFRPCPKSSAKHSSCLCVCENRGEGGEKYPAVFLHVASLDSVWSQACWALSIAKLLGYLSCRNCRFMAPKRQLASKGELGWGLAASGQESHCHLPAKPSAGFTCNG